MNSSFYMWDLTDIDMSNDPFSVGVYNNGYYYVIKRIWTDKLEMSVFHNNCEMNILVRWPRNGEPTMPSFGQHIEGFQKLQNVVKNHPGFKYWSEGAGPYAFALC